jgi:C1A family cysteine protease
MKKLNGLKKDIEDPRDYKYKTLLPGITPAVLPVQVNWTDKMSNVKDQGRLGSCVGFAVAAMKEFQEQTEHDIEIKAGKKYKRKEDQYNLSEMWVYYKAKLIDPWPNEEGTSIKCALQVLKKDGAPCEKAYPYNDKFKGSPANWATLIAKWALIDSYWRLETINDMKLALVAGPIVIGISCFDEIFRVGSGGIVPYPKYPDDDQGGHAICIVGYDDDKQLFKFKNSWGTGWGSGGYGYLSYKYVQDFMWDAWICKDLSVTKKDLVK